MSNQMSIFRLLKFCFVCTLECRFFALEDRKNHFDTLYCLRKKKFGKMANFGPRVWANLFGKISIFRLFKLLFFIA